MKQIGYSLILIGTLGIGCCIAKVSVNAPKRTAFAEPMKAIRDEQNEWIIIG